MMEQRRVQSFTSSPYQYVVDYPASHDLSRCDSHEPITMKNGHGSFDERASFHHFAREQSATQSLSAPIDAFDPWILEGAPCGSPMSTSSSISHPESVPTPPPYTGMPMYDTAGSSAFHHVRSPANPEAWAEEPEPLWRPSYPDVPTWGSQQFSLPYHRGPACEQMSLQPVQDYIPHSGPSVSSAYIQYHAPVASSSVKAITFKQKLASVAELNDKDSSNSESDVSDSDDDDDASLQRSSYSTSRRSGANSNVLKLGKWGADTSSFPFITNTSDRQYQCPAEDKDHAGHVCPKRFQRPEHLRRHLKTVHGNERLHYCKVCDRPFSRGDNLRDHYWTHVQRGGRSGKNNKMSIPELKAILGPKDRPLVKRLKLKLARVRERSTGAKL
jgi:hypothetical protein